MIIIRNKISEDEEIIQLKPEENYKYITNGEVWSDWIILGRTDKIENWHDTNEEPPIPEPYE